MQCPWYVCLGVVIWVMAAFLTLCCCKLAGEVDERIERMDERDADHESL